ncbi:MAG TPA: ABC transporter permease [Candidatus Limnocylindrales bacterium]|jgi:spermidine/putrescine transport system permease protein|nr:ABC transporter permease [Candidatus Limnocylindrales bacterium]
MPSRRWRALTPYLLLAPGVLWLAVFYVYPAIQMFATSLYSGSLEHGYRLTWEWGTYPEALARYSEHFGRSLVYGGAATVVTFLIGYPLAYAIAFRGGRYRNLLLFLVIAPFFTSFLLRTISWKIILGDDGIVLGPLKDVGLLGPDFRLLATPVAVVSGIAYNFLPFMTLPIYVALEKVDRRLVEAAEDLYAGPWRPGGTIAGALAGAGLFAWLGFAFVWNVPLMALVGACAGAALGTLFLSQAFLRVTLPLSLPGVFAGTLLTFIPAMGDYVNAELLGTPQTRMIGNVIQTRFLTNNDYPTAAALSFLLMAAILVAVALYARLLGTEGLVRAKTL